MPVLVTSIQQQLMQKQDMRRCAETLGSILTSLTTGTAVSLQQSLGMQQVYLEFKGAISHHFRQFHYITHKLVLK